MVSHVVMMKPRNDVPTDQRAALIAAFRRALCEIPAIRNVRVGRRLRHGAGYEAHAPDAADYVVVIDFDDLAALQGYLDHPAHQQLGARFRQCLVASLIYDFEIGDIDELLPSFTTTSLAEGDA